MLESKYQLQLIKKLEKMFPGCVIQKNDERETQGIPDLTILYQDRWAMLEVKPHVSAEVQPNQEWYIEQMNRLSYAAFIYPENEEEILDELQRAFGSVREARIPQS